MSHDTLRWTLKKTIGNLRHALLGNVLVAVNFSVNSFINSVSERMAIAEAKHGSIPFISRCPHVLGSLWVHITLETRPSFRHDTSAHYFNSVDCPLEGTWCIVYR